MYLVAVLQDHSLKKHDDAEPELPRLSFLLTSGRMTRVIGIILLVILCDPGASFAAFQMCPVRSCSPWRTCFHATEGKSNNDNDVYKPQMENLLEGLSRNGSANIADLSLNERTKRAMLAEKIEDEIFSRAAELDRLSDDEGHIPNQHMSLAKEIASQARVLQVQYDELVSGKESSVLNAMEQVMDEDDDDDRADRGNSTDMNSSFQ